jgi:hypothetical protein
VPISVGLKKNDPFRLESCDFNDPECIVDNKTSCGTMSACYQILCSSGDTVPEETHPLTLIQGEEVATVQPKGGGGAARNAAGGREAVETGNRNRTGIRVKKEVRIDDSRKNYIGIIGI